MALPAAGDPSEARATEPTEGARGEEVGFRRVVPKTSLSQKPQENGNTEFVANPSTSFVGPVLQVLGCLLVADLMRRFRAKEKHIAVGVSVCHLGKSSACANNISPMLSAALAGDEAAFEVELASADEAMFHQVDKWGCTALHYAAKGGSASIVNRLLSFDVPLEAVDAWDETPLHVAARAGHVGACKALLDAGACIDATNAEGYTSLDVAGQADQVTVCMLLIERGAGVMSPNKQSHDGPNLVTYLLSQQDGQ